MSPILGQSSPFPPPSSIRLRQSLTSSSRIDRCTVVRRRFRRISVAVRDAVGKATLALRERPEERDREGSCGCDFLRGLYALAGVIAASGTFAPQPSSRRRRRRPPPQSSFLFRLLLFLPSSLHPVMEGLLPFACVCRRIYERSL